MPSKVEQMRDTLLLAIEQVKSGVMDPAKAKAIASLAHQVNASLDVELRVLIAAKMDGRAAQLVAPSEPVTKQIQTGTVERVGGVTRHSMGD